MENTEAFHNQRRFSRIEFDSDVHLVNAEGSWKSHLVDISLKGMLLTLPKIWPGSVGDRYLAELFLGDRETVIRMEVIVKHINNNNAGFCFEYIDLDSISHLRRLVELNVGDTTILNRELSDLGTN